MIEHMAVNPYNRNYYKPHQYAKMLHLVKPIDFNTLSPQS